MTYAPNRCARDDDRTPGLRRSPDERGSPRRRRRHARRLLKPEERAKFYAEFLTDDLARADMAARYTAYSQAITNGILNPNEVRAMENRAPYEGGDEYRRPMNTETPGGDNRPGHQPPPAQLPKPRIAA